MAKDRIKVLLAKPTHDCHDRGVRYLMRVLRDAGMEVVFTNFLLPQEVVGVALQEDVDVVGISSSSGGHVPVIEELRLQLDANGIGHALLLVGGVIPEDDLSRLETLGVHKVFGPGTVPAEVAGYIKTELGRKEVQHAGA
ncbi:MAG: cobalamin B12-binding domain-containing protein [Candidatus Methylomirabilia bacterium]